MLIYNVTTKVDRSIAEEWLTWMKEIHIPEVLSSGCFEKYQLLRLLDIDEEEGPTYATQYYAASPEAYEKYIEQYATTFKEHAYKKWGAKFISFRTLMELV
jgi:hypothetical protein